MEQKDVKDQTEPKAKGNHKCTKCGVVFTQSSFLQIHVQTEHNTKKATFPCPKRCGKYFIKKCSIKKHLLTHRPDYEWPIFCLFCGKHFLNIGYLSNHLKSSLHVNDSRIPKPGTPAWNGLMKKSKVVFTKGMKPT